MTSESGSWTFKSNSKLTVSAPVTSSGTVWVFEGSIILMDSTWTQQASAAETVLLTLNGLVTGSGKYNNKRGVMIYGLGAIVKVALQTGSAVTSAQSRHLSATSISALVQICGALIGSTTVSILSGGSLDITQTCLYTGSVIVNSLTVPISVSSTTDPTTTTTVASGGYIQLLSVGEASYLSNFEGDLVWASGSSLVVSLAAEPTYAYTNTIIRYEAVTCDISNPTVSFLNCGLFLCSLTIAAEVEGESCLVSLRVGLSDDDSSSALWWLFMFFFIIPVFAIPAYICSRKDAEAGLELESSESYVYPNTVYGNTPYGYAQ